MLNSKRHFKNLKNQLHSKSSLERREKCLRFFKAGPGEYAEGDKFLGVSVPDIRQLVKVYAFELSSEEIIQLIRSEWHEERQCGLLILVKWYQKTRTEQEKEEYIDLYLNNLDWVNNWDLVDSSAYYLLGDWLLTRDRELLYELAESGRLWRERIAMVSTLAFIKKDQYADTFRLAEILIKHPHDLIQKAVGWMLKEVGKRNPDALREFLADHYKNLSRTSLRYAIEKFPEQERLVYLKGIA